MYLFSSSKLVEQINKDEVPVNDEVKYLLFEVILYSVLFYVLAVFPDEDPVNTLFETSSLVIQISLNVFLYYWLFNKFRACNDNFLKDFVLLAVPISMQTFLSLIFMIVLWIPIMFLESVGNINSLTERFYNIFEIVSSVALNLVFFCLMNKNMNRLAPKTATLDMGAPPPQTKPKGKIIE